MANGSWEDPVVRVEREFWERMDLMRTASALTNPRDVLNHAVNGPDAPAALAAHIYASPRAYICAGAQVIEWSGDSTVTSWGDLPAQPSKPATEQDKALHRALSRSNGTFSRENQCGWSGDE